uniref:CUB domain-containing protein n=1 Tax=Panagrolaimus sp. PS1159 TaxID=55785 RepID=A0AC35FQF9_9BILA
MITHVAIFQAFKSFEIDIKTDAINDLHFLYGTENGGTSKPANLTCDNQCFLILRLNENQHEKRNIHCKIGGQADNFDTVKFDYTPDFAPSGFQLSSRNLGDLLKVCDPFSYHLDQKAGVNVIRASIKCIDIGWNYTSFFNGLQKFDKCLFGLLSPENKQPFFSANVSKSLSSPSDSSKILLYTEKDAKKVPDTNISFIHDGWPKIQIQPNGKNQRFTFIKPKNVRNFPGFIFEYDNRMCNNAKFVIRFFDNDECKIYFHTRTDRITISPLKFDDHTRFFLPTNLTNWIMYFNSPNIRFSDNSFTEFYNSTDFFLCEHQVGEEFVIEFIEHDFLFHCSGLGLGPEVMVEVDAKFIETPAPIPETNDKTKSPTTFLPSTSSSTETSSTTNEASINPWIVGALTLVFFIIITAINVFFIRRKWFKKSKLTIDAFEKHWQYIIPENYENQKEE